MSDPILSALTTSNSKKLTRVWGKRRDLIKAVLLRDSETITEHWRKYVTPLAKHKNVKAAYYLHIIATHITHVLSTEEIDTLGWNKLFYDVGCVFCSDAFMGWACTRTQSKNVFDVLNRFMRVTPVNTPLEWHRMLPANYGEHYANTIYFWGPRFGFTALEKASDFFSFLTYRIPDRELVLDKDPPQLFDFKYVSEHMWARLLLPTVNYFVAAYNLCVDNANDENLIKSVRGKIKTFEMYGGEETVKFFRHLITRLQKSNFTITFSENVLKSFLKIIEVVSVLCLLNDMDSALEILKQCWEPVNNLRLWWEIFEEGVIMDDSVVVLTLVSMAQKQVCRTLLPILFVYCGEPRLGQAVNNHPVTREVVFENIVSETRNGLTCAVNDDVAKVIAKNMFDVISEFGIYTDDIEDVVKKWGKGSIYKHMTTFKKRRLCFLECSQAVTISETCCICCRDDRSMIICAPCGHVFCVLCAPFKRETCHICKCHVESKVNNVFID